MQNNTLTVVVLFQLLCILVLMMMSLKQTEINVKNDLWVCLLLTFSIKLRVAPDRFYKVKTTVNLYFHTSFWYIKIF